MKNTTADTFTADVIENEKLVILYFSAPWCGPCKALGPILEQIDAEYSDRLEVVKVNIDEEEKLAEAYQVTSIPVMKIISGGESKKTIIGAKPKPAIEHELSAFLG
jgi:thioredoxin 1